MEGLLLLYWLKISIFTFIVFFYLLTLQFIVSSFLLSEV